MRKTVKRRSPDDILDDLRKRAAALTVGDDFKDGRADTAACNLRAKMK